MKFTLQLHLLPTKSQHRALLDVMQAFNTAAADVAQVAFSEELFHIKSLHPRCYHDIRHCFNLSAYMGMQVIRQVTTVANIQEVTAAHIHEGAADCTNRGRGSAEQNEPFGLKGVR